MIPFINALTHAIGTLVLILLLSVVPLFLAFRWIDFKKEEWSRYGARKLRRQIVGDAEQIVNDYLESQAEEEGQI